LVLITCKKCGEVEYFTSKAFWNITDFDAISKTVCLAIIAELRKGFKVLKVKRIGEDRGTIYRIQVVK
jgi:hypothetical protein